jgi:transposase InsO family protein
MIPLQALSHGGRECLVLGCRLARYLIIFIWSVCRPKAVLAARLLALQSQLAACKDRIDRKKIPKPRFDPAFRMLWVVISKVLDGWDDLAQVMKPATVKRWHTTAFRIYWRWKSRPGRPPIEKEMQALIRRLSRENPIWSPERIRDTLALLGFEPPCVETVSKYMVRPRRPRKPSGTWKAFLRNHVDASWGMDFFTVTTLNFRTLYVFLVLEHGRRIVRHFAVTEAPYMEWVVQHLREATPFGARPKYLFRDNDEIYGPGVPRFLKNSGIEEVRTAYRSPWQNPYCERIVGTLRREILDHVIVFGEEHLERLLREFLKGYYHPGRPHQGLARKPPIPSARPIPTSGNTKVVSIPVVGGLHHRYERVAA